MKYNMTTFSEYSFDYLLNESQSLLSRLRQVKPFSMTMPMVRGASVSEKALKAVIDLLEIGKNGLYNSVNNYTRIIKSAKKRNEDPKPYQVKFTLIKLRFNSILDQLDIFADVLSQRAEHEVGIWLSGLDVLAEDGLTIGKDLFQDPPALMV